MKNLYLLILGTCIFAFIMASLPCLYSSEIEHKRTYTAEDKGKDIYGLDKKDNNTAPVNPGNNLENPAGEKTEHPDTPPAL